ncbi:hypothetical protein ACFPDQ_04425 [Pseudofrancisella aestuarii]|uniref:CWH43-like N-terminal domain-containing protein n=1 Tax=Pseudofrancisella aestuarii TaxID=2670347 RepID=A0ABV9TC39_9GAMM|nr:hypothetical protein [Pseudofrancisella aestuarii]
MTARFNPKKLISFTTISVAVLFFITYIVSVINGHNQLCVPFISGCSDITHAGFFPYESYMLKAILIPTATLMAVIFFFIKEWLIHISSNNPKVTKQANIMLWISTIGCIGLVIGTAVIDGDKTIMPLHLKAVGIFFVSMTICQVWYTIIESKYTSKVNKLPVTLRRIAIGITLIVAIVSLFMAQTYKNQSIVEWWGVYSLIFWFWTFSLNKEK